MKQFEQMSFERERIAVRRKIATEVLNDIKLSVSVTSDDYLQDTLTAELTAFVYSNLVDERELIYYFDKPTFLDWLLRRKRKAVFNLKVKDLLLNAPVNENTMRVYHTESKWL